MVGMERLDAYVARCALAPSRAKAQRLIRDGSVFVDGVCVRKPSASVPHGAHVEIHGADDYVSRGAYKLLGAFSAFASYGLRPPAGLDCLDIGASTGGFCDVLLRSGARHVIALDVGHGQLDARIAADPRTTEMSGVNIRDVGPEDLPCVPQRGGAEGAGGWRAVVGTADSPIEGTHGNIEYLMYARARA